VCAAIIIAVLIYELHWKKKKARERRPSTE
jgi:hypothetical protein